MRSEHEYPILRQLFGAYLHQDWHDDFETADEAVDAFFRDLAESQRSAARHELDDLIEGVARLGPEEALRLLGELGCDYYPPGDGYSAAGWLEHLRHRIQNGSYFGDAER